MRMPPYLLLRPSGYYFRYTIPHDLRARIGKSEIRKSLHRTNQFHHPMLAEPRSPKLLILTAPSGKRATTSNCPPIASI